MKIIDLIKITAQNLGYTGVFNNEHECGCAIEDVCMLDEIMPGCELGYKNECYKCRYRHDCEVRLYECDEMYCRTRCFEEEDSNENSNP